MAKSFKNLSQPAAAAAPKPVSERDFFDLTDEVSPALPPAPAASPSSSDNTDGISNLGNTSNLSNPENASKPKSVTRPARKSAADNAMQPGNLVVGSNPGDTSTAAVLAAQPTDAAKGEAGIPGRDVRQTFVLSETHLEQLKDYVHARRSQGDYLYSQKQALQEALDLLFGSIVPVAPRPAQLREREQRRRTSIQQGRLAK